MIECFQWIIYSSLPIDEWTRSGAFLISWLHWLSAFISPNSGMFGLFSVVNAADGFGSSVTWHLAEPVGSCCGQADVKQPTSWAKPLPSEWTTGKCKALIWIQILCWNSPNITAVISFISRAKSSIKCKRNWIKLWFESSFLARKRKSRAAN